MVENRQIFHVSSYYAHRWPEAPETALDNGTNIKDLSTSGSAVICATYLADGSCARKALPGMSRALPIRRSVTSSEGRPSLTFSIDREKV